MIGNLFEALRRYYRDPSHDTFMHGWEAAACGEPLSYCSAIGPETERGWEAYWEEYGPDY